MMPAMTASTTPKPLSSLARRLWVYQDIGAPEASVRGDAPVVGPRCAALIDRSVDLGMRSADGRGARPRDASSRARKAVRSVAVGASGERGRDTFGQPS